MEDILQHVMDFARTAHGDQRRKFVDEPYINHPVRVMRICREYSGDILLLSAALLHDVLEDTETKREAVSEFLQSVMSPAEATRTLLLVLELTDIYTKKNYPRLNRRQRKQKEATRLSLAEGDSQTIKYADIIDNSLDVAKAETDFVLVYLKECAALLKKMDKGHPELRKRAMETVAQCIAEQKQM